MFLYFVFGLIVVNNVHCQSEYYNSQVDLILGQLSDNLIKDDLTELNLPELSFNYLVVSADLHNGYIKNLSSISRTGNVNHKTLQQNQTLMLSFAAKFDFMELTYPDMEFYFMFLNPMSNISLNIQLENVVVDLGIMLTKEFHDCSYFINLMTADVGRYDSSVVYRGESPFAKTAVSWMVDRFLSYKTTPIENFLVEEITPALNEALAQIQSTDLQLFQCSNKTTTTTSVPMTTTTSVPMTTTTSTTSKP